MGKKKPKGDKGSNESFYYQRDGILPKTIMGLTSNGFLEPTKAHTLGNREQLLDNYTLAGLTRVRKMRTTMPDASLITLDDLLANRIGKPSLIVKVPLHIKSFEQLLANYANKRSGNEDGKERLKRYQEGNYPDHILRHLSVLSEVAATSEDQTIITNDYDAILPVVLSNYSPCEDAGFFNYGLFVHYGPSNRELKRGGERGKHDLLFAYWTDPDFAIDISKRVAAVVKREVTPLYRPKGRKRVNCLEVLETQKP